MEGTFNIASALLLGAREWAVEKSWPCSQTSKHMYSVITKCVQETPRLFTGESRSPASRRVLRQGWGGASHRMLRQDCWGGVALLLPLVVGTHIY